MCKRAFYICKPGLAALASLVLVLALGLVPGAAVAFADEVTAPEKVTPGTQVAGQLEMEAPREITLGFLPVKLDVSFTPAVIKTGYDCGMDDMCGLDPCLCGVPDSFGACACNGTHDTLPGVAVTPSNTGIVQVLSIGQDTWLIPLGAGESELRIDGALPHYGTVQLKTAVKVNTFIPPPVLYVGSPLFLIVLLVVVCIVVIRRRKHRHVPAKADTWQSPTVFPLMLMLAVAVSASSVLAGCGAPATRVTADSPQLLAATIVSTGDGTEAAQRVEVRIVFDKDITAKGAVLDDLAITLNGKALDDKAIAVSAEVAGADTLLITLSPAAATGGPSSSHFFAVYEGDLSVRAKDGSGGLAHLTASAKEVSAHLSAPLNFKIPSGLVIEVTDTAVGDSSVGTPAQASFRIVTLPCVRAISWFALEPGGEGCIVHNHEFTTYLDDAPSRARYATHVADSLKNSLDSTYIITAKDDTVTITARAAIDGQVIAPALIEGVIR